MFGLLARERWGWWLAVLGAGAALVAPLSAVFAGNVFGLFGMLLPGLALLYLLLDRDVQRTFTPA